MAGKRRGRKAKLLRGGEADGEAEGEAKAEAEREGEEEGDGEEEGKGLCISVRYS